MSDSPTPVVQCSTGPFWAFELEQAMDILAEAGFEQIELMVTRDPQTQDPDIPLQLAGDRGLEIASVHGPFLVVTKSVWGMDPLDKIRRGVEMCRALEATSFVVHPPYLWEGTYARWISEECEAFCDEHGVIVAVETMYPKWVAGRRMRAYRWLEPAALRHAAPYAALDTSHLAIGRHDILDAYRVLSDSLVHIHLSNNAGDGRDGHLEVEQGVLPLEKLLANLHSTGYRGAISLELAVSRYVDRPQELVAMLSKNRKWVESHLKGRRRLTKGLPRR